MRLLLFVSYATANVLRQLADEAASPRNHTIWKFDSICEDPGEAVWEQWQRAAQALEVGGRSSTVDVRAELAKLLLTSGVGGGRSGSAMLMSIKSKAFFVKSLEASGVAVANAMEADYYKHIEAATKGAPSLLTTIGLCKFQPSFTARPSDHTHAVIMTNLRRFKGIVQSFDLKGSKWKNMVDKRARRCDASFVDRSKAIAKYLAGVSNAMEDKDYGVAEGEDMDFVATRSKSYRDAVTKLTKYRCWPKDAQRTSFTDASAADHALATATPGADTGFNEQDGIPMHLPEKRFVPFWAQFKQDVAFLQKHGLMDYSLALNVIADPHSTDTCHVPSSQMIPIVKESKSIAVGIIDFYTRFHVGKKISKLGQRMSRMIMGHRKSSYKTGEPTGFDTIAPKDYGDRFLSFFGRWLRACTTGQSEVVNSACCKLATDASD